MTLKQQRLLLYFFEVLEVNMRSADIFPISKEVKGFLTRDECIDIALWIAPERYHKKELENFNDEKSVSLIYFYEKLLTPILLLDQQKQELTNYYFFYVLYNFKEKLENLKSLPNLGFNGIDVAILYLIFLIVSSGNIY